MIWHQHVTPYQHTAVFGSEAELAKCLMSLRIGKNPLSPTGAGSDEIDRILVVNLIQPIEPLHHSVYQTM